MYGLPAIALGLEVVFEVVVGVVAVGEVADGSVVALEVAVPAGGGLEAF
jgi:hypothetical protein